VRWKIKSPADGDLLSNSTIKNYWNRTTAVKIIVGAWVATQCMSHCQDKCPLISPLSCSYVACLKMKFLFVSFMLSACLVCCCYSEATNFCDGTKHCMCVKRVTTVTLFVSVLLCVSVSGVFNLLGFDVQLFSPVLSVFCAACCEYIVHCMLFTSFFKSSLFLCC